MSPFRGSFIAKAKTPAALLESLAWCIHQAGPDLFDMVQERDLPQDKVSRKLLAEAIVWADHHLRPLGGQPLSIDDSICLYNRADISLA